MVGVIERVREINWINLKSFIVISLIGFGYGYWFASNQLLVISPQALSTYPPGYFLLTIFKSYLVILMLFCLSSRILYQLSRAKMPSIIVSLTFTPLLFSWWSWPVYQIVTTIFSLQAIALILGLRKQDYHWLGKQYFIDGLALLIFFILHLFLTTRFSPFHWYNAMLAAEGYNSEEILVLAPLFKGYALAKQFSFSFVDHAQWAGVMNPPITFNSPLLQLFAFVFDLPSVSYDIYHKAVMGLCFIMMVGGSFGFYLFLRYGAKVYWPFALFGGYLFFFSGSPILADTFTTDGSIFLSSYCVLPYALMLISLAFAKADIKYAAWSGAALSSQFFLLAPHPEGAIYTILLFSIYTFGLFYFTENLAWRQKAILAVSGIGFFFLLSAFTIMPIIIDRLAGNIYVFAHIGDVTSIKLAPFVRYFVLTLIFVPLSFILLAKQKRLVAEYKSVLLLSLFLAALILLAHHKAFVVGLVNLLHIGLHFWVVSRIGMYFCLCVFILSAFTLDALARYVTMKIIQQKVI